MNDLNQLPLLGSGTDEPSPEDWRLMYEAASRQLDLLRTRIGALLRHVGRPALCDGPNCHAQIFFVQHLPKREGEHSASSPYNPDGSSHWATCPDRELFRTHRA